MRRGDFGADHQNRPRLAGAHRVDGQFQRKRGRRTGHIHVKSVALNAQRGLDFHAHGGIGPLHIGRSANQTIHIGGGFASGVQRGLGGVHANFGHHGNLRIRSGRKARTHAGGVEHAGLVHHVAVLDARGFFDELHAGIGQGRAAACGDLIGVAGIFQGRKLVIGLDQLGVGDGLRRRKQAGTADGDTVHGKSLFVFVGGSHYPWAQ